MTTFAECNDKKGSNMATTMTQADMRRTAQALWTLIEPQPQEVKDYLVKIITAPSPAQQDTKPEADEISPRPQALRGCLKDIPMGEGGKSKEEVEEGYALIEHLSGILKDIPMEAFADDERAQYILSK